MSTTKLCPKCSFTLDALAESCSQCRHLFKEICHQCYGAYPLAKLRLVSHLLWCEDCLQKQTAFIEQGRYVPSLSQPKKSSFVSFWIWIWSLVPLFGTIQLLRIWRSSPQKIPPFLGFNLLWTVFFFYGALEFYFFSHQKNPSAKISLLIQEIQRAQELYKQKKNGYGMLEQLVAQDCLPWKIEITARQVFAEKEDYHFLIYLSSKTHWKLKAVPKNTQSFSLRFYSDQSGQIRFTYQGEADETSLPWHPEQITFFHYLLQESLLSQFLRHYL